MLVVFLVDLLNLPVLCRTYFVEYQFPVVAASRDSKEQNTMATETVRAVSKKVEKSGG